MEDILEILNKNNLDCFSQKRSETLFLIIPTSAISQRLNQIDFVLFLRDWKGINVIDNTTKNESFTKFAGLVTPRYYYSIDTKNLKKKSITNWFDVVVDLIFGLFGITLILVALYYFLK